MYRPGILTRVSFFAAVLLWFPGTTTAQDSRPNILVIITDQQAASAMSAAGNPYLNTPAIDSIAARGVRYEKRKNWSIHELSLEFEPDDEVLSALEYVARNRPRGNNTMKFSRIIILTLFGLFGLLLTAQAADDPSPQQTSGDPFMGDWKGTWGDDDFCMQVIALGDGKYSANVLLEFDTRDEPLAVLEGARAGNVVTFRGQGGGTNWQGTIDSGQFTGITDGGHDASFALEPVVRLSPTLGAEPPKGAIVLFDGTNLDSWVHPAPDHRVLDLGKLMKGDHRVAYLRTQVWSPSAQRLRLEMGSDDGVKAWLNGKLVHANNVTRGASPGQDVVEVSVTSGWTTLLLKITQADGGFGACAQFTALNRGPNTGIFALRDQPIQRDDAPRSGVSLDDRDGAILDWQVSGPYTSDGLKAKKLFDEKFAPEERSSDVKWTWMLHEGQEARTCRWKLLDNGAMEVSNGGIVSRHPFKDHKLHLEFRTPFMPEARGQSRGNSGVYLQGRYEVQILESYGLQGESNECGGIYQVSAPRVNMAAPPLQWQTYDITFRAPRFDATGRKVKDATLLTVLHNGVMIQEDLAIPNPTAAHIGGDIREAQGVHLQDHGNPVQFRNIWAVELD